MKIELKNPSEFQKMLLLKGFSQRNFAKKLDLSPPYINQIVNNKRYPSAKVAKQITDLLEVKFEDIFFIRTAC